jgi:hypothetical protein
MGISMVFTMVTVIMAWLVVWKTILKNDGVRQIGMMTSPIYEMEN